MLKYSATKMKQVKNKEAGFFEKQLARRFKTKSLVLSAITGIFLFVGRNLVQSFLIGGSWFLDAYEVVVEIGLSILFGLGQFFMWKWQGRKKHEKITQRLKGEDFILANYAFYADQIHNYRGVLFLKHSSLNFKGNYYSKERNIQIELSDISNVTIHKVFWLKRGISVLDKKGIERRFLTEEAGIWLEAIQQEIDVNSKRDN